MIDPRFFFLGDSGWLIAKITTTHYTIRPALSATRFAPCSPTMRYAPPHTAQPGLRNH